MNGSALPELPRLRHLDIRHHTHNGHPHVMLRDPLNLSDQALLVPQPLAVVLSFCDGTHTAPEMARRFSSVYGISVDESTVQGLLSALDSALLLDNQRSREALSHARDTYRAQEFRSPFLAGQSYPASGPELRAALDTYGQMGSTRMDNAPRADAADAQIVGLLSPHIDYPRGGITYAHVWNRSAQAARNADLVVIIATDHYGDDPFTLTRQHFATPFGVLPTAAKIVDKLAAAIGEEQAFAGELRHVGEHSIELVVNWLHHVRNGEPCEIVPILCGSYAHFHPTRQGEPSQEALDQIVAVLRSELVSRNVLVVASGDLSHVGSAFGGSPLDAARRAAVKDADDRLIRHMSTGNSDAFLEEIHAASDVNNVCGAAPIYLTMRTLGDVHGEMTSYATCPADEIDTSAVTISGIVFQHANGSA